MECTIEKDKRCRIILNISLPEPEYAETYKKAGQEVRKNARVPGFRQGKVPENVFQKNFGASIREHFLDLIFPIILDKSQEQQNFQVISTPMISDLVFEPGQPLTCKIIFEQRPEPVVTEYRKLPITRIIHEISDADVNQYIDSSRERMATYLPVNIRNAQEGDRVKADLDVYGEGNARIAELSGENQIIMLQKSESFFDALIEVLIGAANGSQKTVPLTFPADHPKPEYRNRKVTIKVTVKQIEEKQMPELNDDLVKKISRCETVAAYRSQVRELLSKNLDLQLKRGLEDQVISRLLEKYGGFEVPHSSVMRRKEYLVKRIKDDLEKEKMSLADYLKRLDKTESEFESGIEAEAEKLVKLDYLYFTIAQTEKFEITDEDMNREFERLSRSYNVPLDKIRKRYDHTGATDALRFDLMEHKVINFLVENADIKETKKSVPSLKGDDRS